MDIGALVSAVCDDLADFGGAVSYDCEDGIVVACKRVAMKRAVLSLIENTVKYGHSAQVAVRREGSWASITIEDQGPGISEAELARLLLPFRRGGGEEGEPERSGHGLGLAIAHAILGNHSGGLRFNNRQNGGLIAHLSLPTFAEVT
ncbi:MAG: sensor histidine kinase [Limimaricola soesokkakensis]|uniref:sensor histidine kinase n=1 Tax=Limimaricola soesokkakensis TaxID=1343159 RepID=UPI004057E513